jgi:DNA helicase-2/ATP-dependent DNA helicase PcrA
VGDLPAGPSLLDGLNDSQREAVLHPDGPLLVVAGAGSGKTRVLTHRIAHLIASGRVGPSQVLAITFTNKASEEMRRRVEELVGPPAAFMWVSTFHAACVKILRREAPRRGYRSNFTIYDQDDAVRLTQYVLRDLGIDAKKFPPRQIQARISAAKAELVDFESFARRGGEDPVQRVVAEVYPEYQKRLFQSNAMDFDDLLMLTYELFNSDEEVLQRWRSRFRHVLVDEYQDTNRAQAEIAFLLGAEHGNVCVVGDADQSIYSWRKADVRNILDFEKRFPGARVVLLEQNYRSTKTILDAANAVIANNVLRRPKDLWTSREGGDPIVVHEADSEDDEASWIVAEIRRLVEVGEARYRDIAVFYRTNAQSRAIEEELVAWQVPYRVLGGLRFYDRREVKDLLSYLRVVANPYEEVSLKRVLNVPKRGIGEQSLAKLEVWARREGVSLYEALRQEAGLAGDRAPGLLSARAAKGVTGFLSLIEDARQALDAGKSPAFIAESLLDQSGYLVELEAEGGVEASGRIENLRELVASAEGYESLEEMLEATALVADADSLDNDRGCVVLMTIHTAKGLEFPVVFMVGMEEGVFPHSRSLTDRRALEEERRLAYVGITRARERLYLTYAGCRSQWGEFAYNPRSRFVDEIPQDLLVEV